MHPSAALANEIGMGFGNFEVVGILQIPFAFDGNDALALPIELIHNLAGSKLAGYHPTQIAYMERMPGRGADDLASAIGGGKSDIEDLPVVTSMGSYSPEAFRAFDRAKLCTLLTVFNIG